jgi:hypothetical protein
MQMNQVRVPHQIAIPRKEVDAEKSLVKIDERSGANDAYACDVLARRKVPLVAHCQNGDIELVVRPKPLRSQPDSLGEPADVWHIIGEYVQNANGRCCHR